MCRNVNWDVTTLHTSEMCALINLQGYVKLLLHEAAHIMLTHGIYCSMSITIVGQIQKDMAFIYNKIFVINTSDAFNTLYIKRLQQVICATWR